MKRPPRVRGPLRGCGEGVLGKLLRGRGRGGRNLGRSLRCRLAVAATQCLLDAVTDVGHLLACVGPKRFDLLARVRRELADLLASLGRELTHLLLEVLGVLANALDDLLAARGELLRLLAQTRLDLARLVDDRLLAQL